MKATKPPTSPLQNIIAPDSQIPLRFPATEVLVSATQTWHFHAALLDDPPVLSVSPLADGRFRLGWNAPGFALESATGFTPGPDGKPGPWIEVPNMANPSTNSPSGDMRLFRLRK